MRTVEEFLRYLRRKENVWLYGAGKIAGRVARLCKKEGIHVQGVMVSARGQNPIAIEGLRVWSKEELAGHEIPPGEMDVVVAFAVEKRRGIDELAGKGFRSLLFLTSEVQEELRAEDLQDEYNAVQDAYTFDTRYPGCERGQAVLVERSTGRPVIRFPALYKGMSPVLLEHGTRQEAEQILGQWEALPHGGGNGISRKKMKESKTEIYVVATCRDPAGDLGEGYIPLQAGAACASVRRGCPTDDTGDNISWKNRDYSECTALYWIWRNTGGQEYVGLYHYRRRLALDDSGLDAVRERGIDAVLALPQFEALPMREFFVRDFITAFDWTAMRKAILQCEPEWADVFVKYEEGHFYFPCNIGLWRREWFDRYCAFAFSVADIVERENVCAGIYRNDRYMGYLFESMATVFLMAMGQKMRIACTGIEWTEEG